MNIERLNNLLYEIKTEVKVHSIPSLLQSFQTTFTQNINQPNQPNADAFIQAHDVLKEALNQCRSNRFSPSQRTLLESIGGAPFVGTGLMSTLEQIIQDNSATPGQAVTEVQKHVKKASEFFSTVENANANLEGLGIEYDFTQKDQYELGVLLPTDLFKNNLEGLAKEISLLNRHLKTFGELAEADTASPTLRCVSSGSLEFFLDSLPAVADCLSDAIQQIVLLYLAVLHIRKLRRELKEKKVPAKALKPVEDYEKERVTEELKRIAHDLFKRYRKKQDKVRDKELHALLVQALKYITRRIDQGVDFEVTPPSEFEEPAEDATEKAKKEHEQKVAHAKELSDRSAKIKQLPKREQPILFLTEPKEENEDSPTKESSTTS